MYKSKLNFYSAPPDAIICIIRPRKNDVSCLVISQASKIDNCLIL